MKFIYSQQLYLRVCGRVKLQAKHRAYLSTCMRPYVYIGCSHSVIIDALWPLNARMREAVNVLNSSMHMVVYTMFSVQGVYFITKADTSAV